MATGDSANFRSQYYDKVGFRNVPETKSLDQILSRNPVDVSKLCNLCQRISVPPGYRETLWKLILGVTPADHSISGAIETDHRGQYEDLYKSLKVMRLIDDTSTNVRVITLMILLERGELNSDVEAQLEEEKVTDMKILINVICKLSNDLYDAYWMARNFLSHMDALQIDVEELVRQTHQLLQKEDKTYIDHLTKHNGCLPIRRWFTLLFAPVLPETALFKVWDRMLGGLVNKHLVNTAKVLLIHMKPSLISAQEWQELHKLLHTPLSEDAAALLTSNL